MVFGSVDVALVGTQEEDARLRLPPSLDSLWGTRISRCTYHSRSSVPAFPILSLLFPILFQYLGSREDDCRQAVTMTTGGWRQSGLSGFFFTCVTMQSSAAMMLAVWGKGAGQDDHCYVGIYGPPSARTVRVVGGRGDASSRQSADGNFGRCAENSIAHGCS